MIQGTINPRVLEDILAEAPTRCEGYKRLTQFVREGLEKNRKDPRDGFSAEDFSIWQLGVVMGAIDPVLPQTSWGEFTANLVDLERVRPDALFTESNPVLTTHAFQTIITQLIDDAVIRGYESDEGFIGDRLVTTMSSPNRRNLRIPGLTGLAEPLEVKEGHPYPETGFDEKYVTTEERKYGRIISLTMETMMFDPISIVLDKARSLAIGAREFKERLIVRGVIDADSSSGVYVYRPNGTGEALYSADNQNYIGVGGVTGYNAAVPLTDYEDIDTVRQYRATQVKDDRRDGLQRAVRMLNSKAATLLVPVAKEATAWRIKNQTALETKTNTGNTVTHNSGSPVRSFMGEVLSSPILDEVSQADWYIGTPKDQFVWVEQRGISTFTQGASSEAAFERDVNFRIKVAFMGGISAKDSIYFTKVDGE